MQVYNFKNETWETTNQEKTSSIVDITPRIATQLLQNNNKNRKIKQNLVNKYTRDMLDGNWHIGEGIIAFDKDKNALNGQHRLLAIIESNTTQSFVVAFGLSKEDQAVMDAGRTRSLYDVATLQGMDISPFASSVGRYIRRQTIRYLPRRATRAEEVNFLKEHLEMLEWTNNTFRPVNLKRKNKAPLPQVGNDIASAFARAYMYYKNIPEKLQRLEIFAKGLVYDNAFLELRISNDKGISVFTSYTKWLVDHIGNQGQKARNDRYHRTEIAITFFVNGQDKTIGKSQDELFLLDVEMEAKELLAVEGVLTQDLIEVAT